MSARRLFTAAILGVALVPLGAGAANAAPPGNDEFPGAVVLNLGSQVQEDTTQATTNAGDDVLNTNCGAPETGASVWYQYTPAANGTVALDATASDYSVGLMVFKGTPTADSMKACGPGSIGLPVKAGQTYYVMAFSDSSSTGGNLVLSLKNAPPPVVHVAAAKRGTAFHGGAAQLHGTYSCRHGESFAEVDAHLLQLAGRLKIQADGGTSVQCDGQRHSWSVRLVSPVGTYAPGNAKAKISIIACGLVVCRHTSVKSNVHLTKASSSHQRFVRPSRAPRQHPKLSLHQHWPRAWAAKPGH